MTKALVIEGPFFNQGRIIDSTIRLTDMSEFKVSEDGKWYRVSLRLMGDGLNVDDLTAKLHLDPDTVGKKGEHYQNSPIRGKYETNLWGYSSEALSDVPFEKQIGDLLDLLEPKRGALREILSLPDVAGELFLGYGSDNGQGGAYFSPELSARIAGFRLSLDLDLYPPPGDD